MKTREMVRLLLSAKYPIKLMAEQSGIGYYRLYRYSRCEGASLSLEDKTKLWKFARRQPIVEDALQAEID